MDRHFHQPRGQGVTDHQGLSSRFLCQAVHGLHTSVRQPLPPLSPMSTILSPVNSVGSCHWWFSAHLDIAIVAIRDSGWYTPGLPPLSCVYVHQCPILRSSIQQTSCYKSLFYLTQPRGTHTFVLNKAF